MDISWKRDGYLPGVPCWVDTSQPDPQAAAAFYAGLFGWEFEDRMPEDAPGHYFVARLEGADVAAVGSQMAEGPVAWSTYIWVESADETAAKVTAAGGTVLAEPFDVLDAGRMAIFADPAGAVFSVWQAGTHRGAEVVNAAGTWNWSDLNTSDFEGAKAFYGAVFGWKPLGGDDFTMWTVPGYSDFLQRNDPGIKERHKEAGAPEGFSDAIGWMQPLRGEAPPHWSVTFSVDDVDAVAARAAELGGRVIVEPFDVEPVRIAVLSDPAGAVFAVNKYDPTD
jgi:predicted enzyme related to lactoylglutathione lyase